MKQPARGFSAIEIMIILIVLALLAALQYPGYQDAVRKTRRAEGRAALMQLMQQQERYYSQHTTYVAFSLAAPNGFKWFSGDDPGGSAYEINGAPCKGDVIQNCVILAARPGTENVNRRFNDEACGDLTLTSSGVHAATGSAASCW